MVAMARAAAARAMVGMAKGEAAKVVVAKGGAAKVVVEGVATSAAMGRGWSDEGYGECARARRRLAWHRRRRPRTCRAAARAWPRGRRSLGRRRSPPTAGTPPPGGDWAHTPTTRQHTPAPRQHTPVTRQPPRHARPRPKRTRPNHPRVRDLTPRVRRPPPCSASAPSARRGACTAPSPPHNSPPARPSRCASESRRTRCRRPRARYRPDSLPIRPRRPERVTAM